MNRLFPLALSLLLLLTSAGCVSRAAAPEDAGQPAPQDMSDLLPLDAETEDFAVEEVPGPPAEPEEPYVRVIDPAKPMVALTFDDGPDDTHSDEILDTLEKNHALATFFEVGKNVLAYPEPVRRMADMGCEVASHSNAHKDLSKLKKKALLQDLDTADAAFLAAGTEAPTLVRPPYGAVNKTVKSASGRAMITWTVDTEDWRSRDAQTVVDYVKSLDDLDGEIILMHSIYESTAQAVEILVPWLQEQGYQLVTVTELMAYYYGELPQPDHFYGYTYFSTHGRTDSPVPLPGEEIPGMGQPVGEISADPAEQSPEDPADSAPDQLPEPESEDTADWEPVRTPAAGTSDLSPAKAVPNPALFNP